MKKMLCVLTAAVLLFTSVLYVSAEEKIATEYYSEDIFDGMETIPTLSLVDGKPDVQSAGAVLIEPETLTVLYENNCNEQLAPASITKIMSLLLIMEAIEKGTLTLETEIAASEYACSMGGSQIWLEPGEKMTVDELLKAIVIASANDATVALGEAISGSEEAFVAAMNARAKELGMTGTHFKNCTGLDTEGHLTTAYDVALMSCALIKHELITNYSTVWMDTLRGGESQLVNTNKLVRFYDGCIGLKTGTTSKAGHCLSAAAKRDGMTLIAVVMKGADSNARFGSARAMLDFGFANYSFKKIDSELDENTYIKLSGGVKKAVRVEAKGSISALSKKGDTKVTRQVLLDENVKAPVNKGDSVGKIIVSQDGEELGIIKITAAETVKKRSIFTVYGWLLKGILTF